MERGSQRDSTTPVRTTDTSEHVCGLGHSDDEIGAGFEDYPRNDRPTEREREADSPEPQQNPPAADSRDARARYPIGPAKERTPSD